jgi:hypothetical protein
MKREKIFVRLIDGVETYIPINAKKISDNKYELLPDEEYEYESPNYLFEFFPGDIVLIEHHKFSDGIIGKLAKQLIFRFPKKDTDYLEFKFQATLGVIPFNKETFEKYQNVIERIKIENSEGVNFYPAIIEAINKLDEKAS